VRDVEQFRQAAARPVQGPVDLDRVRAVVRARQQQADRACVRIGRGVADPADAHRDRRRQAEMAGLEGREQRVPLVAAARVEPGERVDLRVREPRATEAALSRLVEDPVAAARDDGAGLVEDDGSDRDRPGRVGGPHQLEDLVPRIRHSAILELPLGPR